MVLVSAVQISVGFVWHVVYRAKFNWSLKREGALAAAALVAIIGAVDFLHSLGRDTPADRPAMNAEIQSAPVHTATATPVVTEATTPVEILPAGSSVDTVAASASPEILTDGRDLIAEKIKERFGDDVATGSLPSGQ